MTRPKPPRYGIFTPYTLQLHHASTGEKPSSFLKRAAILFENFLFVPEGLGPLMDPGSLLGQTWFFDLLFDSKESKMLTEFRRLFLLDHQVWPDYADFANRLRDSTEHDLWHGPSAKRFAQWVADRVEDDVRTGKTGDSPRERREGAKSYIGNLSYDYKLLVAASQRSDEFAGLFSRLHQEAASSTFGTHEVTGETIVQSLAEVAMCDFGALSWEQIFILRRSGFVDDFRKQIADWTMTTNSHLTPDQLGRSIDRLVKDAMFSLIEETKPDLPLSVMSAVVGAIPGLGALASAKTLYDASTELHRQRQYGWLYFVQSVRALTRG